jgi:hypothetical protein
MIATLDPAHIQAASWTGYQCMTGDGRFAVAVVAPASSANSPTLRQRGAYAYSVNLRNGHVVPLASRVALMYFNPGCGDGSNVVLSRYLGSEEQQTQVLVVDAATGRVRLKRTYDHEVTSAVGSRAGLLGTVGRTLVRLTPDRLLPIRRFDGQPFDLRPSAEGIDLLVATPAGRALVDSLTAGGIREDGVAENLYSAGLFLGRGGRNVLALAGSPSVAGSFRRMRSPAGEVGAASLGGQMLLSDPPERLSATAARAAERQVAAPVITDTQGRPLARVHPSGGTLRATTAVAEAPGERLTARTAASETPTCAVPRLNTKVQVLQPNAIEVDWAVQQAARGYLKGSVLTRPKNYANLGLAAYEPSKELPPPTLYGYPGVPIPRSVIEATLAQESNFDQASFHALPGVAGDPLIADYYGAEGTINKINYAKADCGYGIGQITTGMTASSTTPYTSEQKTKIAVDYAENIAAADQILGSSWNTLAENGITLNGGNPSYLENWYLATWAYNTGFHPNTGSGPWGLGWTNNPQNSSYPPNRLPFLRTTYEDAAHPANWPYQERIIGWMETPLLNYKGERSYEPSTSSTNGTWLQIPAFSTFCTASNNCSPKYKNPANESLDYCELESRECWWHLAVKYAECPAHCATSSFKVSSTAKEPIDDPTYLPECESILPAGTIIVDDESTDYNLRGCTTANWKSTGTFTVKYGENASKQPVGEIDWHQLGTGFGGHLYFTHNRKSTETELINTGTWTPGTITPGVYAIQAHIPVNGATTPEATYKIYPGDGTSSTVTLNQHVGGNQWVPLGDYNLLKAGAKVVLTNVTNGTPGSTDVAFDAIAFTYIAHAPNDEQELALKFEPVLKFDTEEKWRPLNLTAFFGETETNGTPIQHKCIPYESPDASTILGENPPFKHTPGDFIVPEPAGETFVEVDVARCQPVATIEQATSWRSPDAYIDIGELGAGDNVEEYHSSHAICLHNGLLDCNGNEQSHDPYSAQYYYISDASGHQFIQYWQYYRYNSFSNAIKGFGSHHEGDWEAVAIAPSLDGSHFEFASFSQHGKWYSYMRSVMGCADQSDGTCGTQSAPRGKRVDVYVANGDHANYATPCKEEIAFECPRGDGELPNERGHDGKDNWGHDFDNEGLYPMPSLDTESWTTWPGHWGATPTEENSPWIQPGYGSPKSPGAQTMFEQPWGSCGKDVEHDECALPARNGVASTQTHPLASAASLVKLDEACGTWFGAGVTALVCSPQALGTDVAHRRLASARGGIKVTVNARRGEATWRYGVAPDFAQVAGRLLHPGDQLVATGQFAANTKLVVRIAGHHGQQIERVIALPAGRHRYVITVVKRGATVFLRISRSGHRQ